MENEYEPLDLMSYFVDERLMEMADSEDPVQFFREYMAGFVISKRESAVSHCGSRPLSEDDSDNYVTIDDLMCYMLSTTPVVQNDPVFTDIIQRHNNLTQCTGNGRSVLSYVDAFFCLSPHLSGQYTQSNTSLYPNCNNTILTTMFDDTMLSLTNKTTDYTMISNSFEVDGLIRQESDSTTIDGVGIVGRLYAPYGGAEITGATVYYNNQVILSLWIIKCINALLLAVAFPHASCCSECLPYCLPTSLVGRFWYHLLNQSQHSSTTSH